MGLLDSIVGQVSQALAGAPGQAHPGLVDVVGSLLDGSQGGGLAGLVRQFEQQGLGHLVQSWIGSGANLAITPDQVQAVLGEPHLQAAAEGLLDEYKSPKLPELHDWAQRHAEQAKFRTNAIYLGALGIGYNSEVLKKRGIAAPKCWADLLDAKFRDEVQIADPSSSGTAYVFLATTVQRLGEDKGFDFLKSLHKNISQYTKSGIAPVKATALGETAVGIAFIHDMLTQKLQGAPIETVAPCEGTGYETGSVSVIKGGKNPEAARRFVDTSRRAADAVFSA